MVASNPYTVVLRNFFLTILSLAFFIPAQSQLNASITRYSTSDGLSHAGVLCTIKDRDGFMWFGTFDGLNRFDGQNFVIYKSRPGDQSTLKSNKIRNIVEDRQGYLWVETYDSKIYRFDKKTEQFTPVSEGKFKHLFNDQLVINKIIPDDKNGVWLLTERDGIFYAREDQQKLPSVSHFAKGKLLNGNVIQFFDQDSQGNVWVGTDGGLNRFKRQPSGGYQRVRLEQAIFSDLGNTAFTCITKNENRIFFGTASGHLVSFDLQTKAFTSKKLATTQLNALCYSSSGLIYVSTSTKGLLIYDPKTNQLNSSASSSTTFLSLYEDRNGQIWIEPVNSGVIKYNPKTGQYKHFMQQKDLASSARGYEVFTDANGILWTRMKGGGFGYYDVISDELRYFYNRPGATDQKFSNIITSLYSDNEGVLWLCAKDGGINKIVLLKDKFNFRKVNVQAQSRAENEVRAIFKDAKNRLWMSTKDGQIHVYENNVKVNLFQNPVAALGFVYCITEDRNGNIWMGTKGNGLYKATPVDGDRTKYRIKNYRNRANDPTSLSNDLVYAVLEDSKGRVWIGTFGGGINLYKTVGNSEIFDNHQTAFKNYPFAWAKVVRHMSEDGYGRIWVATSNGLLVFNPKAKVKEQFLTFRKVSGDQSSLGSNSVQHVYRDKTGQMWLATFGGGLNRAIINPKNIDDIKFESFTVEHGLANDVVLGITGDARDHLWMTTEGGLTHYDPKSKIFKNYDASDGLSKSGFSESAMHTSKDGKIYIGCIDGYISFVPTTIDEKKSVAKMALTGVQIYYKNILPAEEGSPLKESINETKSLVLDHDQNVISLDYAVLDYRLANKVSYAYKLEGFDESWHFVNDQRKATYTNIPPGTYTFRVRVANPYLFENLPEKSLEIVVKPPFYRTTVAYFVYLILLAFMAIMARRIIMAMIRLRNKVLVEQKLTEMKLSFFTNISHELRTPLTLIVSPLEEISKNEQLTANGNQYLQIINRNTNRMIRFINQLLDFRKIQSGKVQLSIAPVDLLSLSKSIGSCFTGMAEEKQISFEVSSTSEQVFVWGDEEKIDIIIYNLLSNAFKFTGSGKAIKLTVNYLSSGDVELNVIDEGPGVAPDKLDEIFEIYYEGLPLGGSHLKGTGIGLPLAKGLAASHDGQLLARNNEDVGMTFTLFLKGGKDHFNPEFIHLDAPSHAIDQALMPKFEAANADLPQPTDERQLPQLLIVEDNPDLQGFLSLKLGGLYRIKSANDGIEGLEMAQAMSPDLIISDVMMPRMNGIELLSALRNNEQTSHIPVIMLTAKSSIESQIEGLNYGADIYLTKPFHTDYLLASIKNLILSRKRIFERLSGEMPKKTPDISPSEAVITSRDEAFLTQVIKIVEEKLNDPEFNIEDVAIAIGMGRTTFYKKLKSLSSLSPVEFVREMRLKRSIQLLDSGSYTVSEVAYLSGFNSLAYFSTCFKEKFKVSPSVYLKK